MAQRNTQKRSTGRSLLLSVLSLTLCIAMLLGTTYAWFTDSVESGINQITAGNLDVELIHTNKTAADEKVTTNTKLFTDVKLWEPGALAYETLTVKNVGTLALKYRMSMNFENETKVNGHGLSEILKVGTIEGKLAANATRESVVAQITSWAPLASFVKTGALEAETDGTPITYVIYWEPSANDDLYNMKNELQGKTLSIDFGIVLVATQYTSELDSFDKYYDVTAAPIDVYTVEEFNEAVKQTVGKGENTTINIMTAGLDLTVAYEDEKMFTLRGEKINKLTANIPNGTIHVYNEVDTVSGTNVDLENSAHFYNKVSTLNATAGLFVVEPGATIENIVAKPVLVTDDASARENAKDLIIEVKGVATKVIAPTAEPEKDVEIKVAGTVEEVEVQKADTKIAVKVEEEATITKLNITDETEDAKIVLQNDGTVGNEGEIKAKTQIAADIAEDDKVMTINNAGEFKAFAKEANGGKNYKGWTIKLGKDIDLAGVEWTPIGRTNRFEGTFDGQNHTIKNLTSVLDSTSATMYGNGLFGDITGGAVLKNFVVENADIHDAVDGKGNVYGIVCGYAYGNVTFENITVKNSKVSAFGKVAAILGMAADAGGTTTIKNCKVENTEITGAYNCATFAGLTQNAVVMSGNTQSNVTFKYSSRYGAEYYTDVDSTATSGESVNGKYWKYTDAMYYAAWADLYNEQKATKIMDGTVSIDALVHGVTRTVTPVGGQTMIDALKAAINAAGEGDTIALSDDVEGSITLEDINGLTIDFNGHWLKGKLSVEKSEICLKDSTGKGGITGVGTMISAKNESKITVDGGNYIAVRTDTASYVSAINLEASEMVVNNGKFSNEAPSDKGSYCYLFSLNYGWYKNLADTSRNYYKGSKVTVNGGDVTAKTSSSYGYIFQCSNDDYWAKQDPSTINAVTINGGSFETTGSYGFLTSGVVNAVVNDCTFVGNCETAFNVSSSDYDYKILVNGGNYTIKTYTSTSWSIPLGSFTGSYPTDTAPVGKVELRGGTINSYIMDGSKIGGRTSVDLVADGYHVVDNGDGTMSVVAN